MHKNTLWFIFVLVLAYLMVVFCQNTENVLERNNDNLLSSESRELSDEARVRRRHKHLYRHWGWHALAIAYWIKVKVVIVSFFVGTAVFWAFRYFWPHKCSEISGSVVLDHPPSSYYSHDHIPYSFDHFDHSPHFEHSDHFDHSFPSSEPYSGYLPPSSVEGPPPSSSGRDLHTVKRRSVEKVKESRQNGRKPEEQIAEIVFQFLGLDSLACRRRFICEMEFRFKNNPLTNMAFRIVGVGFFRKYTNSLNPSGQATRFRECAAVNPQCVFIEQNDNYNPAEPHVEVVTEEQITENQDEDPSLNDVHDEDNEVTAHEQQNDLESENRKNLKAEKRYRNRLRRHRGDRKLDNIVEHLLEESV